MFICRCLTSYKACHPAEMDFNEGHILHVVDTVVNHPPNCWLALNLSVDSSDRQPKVIPNLKRFLVFWCCGEFEAIYLALSV